MNEQIENLNREATRCNRCFAGGTLTRPFVDIAQPRPIGPGYWEAKPRVVVVMLNPGAGGENEYDREALGLIRAFRDGAALAPVTEQMRRVMPLWADGRYVDFIKDLGLELDSIATLNVAWCASEGNKYPKIMLNTCWQLHTAKMLNLLAPDVIVLSGSAAHQFAPRVSVKTVCTIHYAYRGSDAARAQAIEVARREIAAV